MDNKKINPQDKRIYGGQSDVNQLMPFKHKWAYDAYLEANKHHWLPGHVQYDLDTRLKGFYHVQLNSLRFASLELYLSWRYVTSWFCRSILPTVYRNTTSPECRQFFLRMLQEESVAIAAIDGVPLPTIQQPIIAEGETCWRNNMIALLKQGVEPYLNKDDLDTHEYMVAVTMILQLKAYSLTALESYLLEGSDLPPEMKRLVMYLKEDSGRQRVFFTNLLRTFLVEQPQLGELAAVCLRSSMLQSFHHHWFLGSLDIPAAPIQFAEYVLNTVIQSATGVAPEKPVSSPYLDKTVAAHKETQHSSLEWD